MPKPLKRLEDPEFFHLIATATPFEAIIKGAIAVEAEMEALFERAFFDPEALAEIGLTYSQKATLLIALGLQPRFAPPLRALAKMRNKFAHNLDAEFSESDADNFHASFAKEDRDVIGKTLAHMPANRDEPGRAKAFKDLDARDKLSICIVTLRSAVIAAQQQTIALLTPLAPKPDNKAN
ncbi:hypothetical protein Rleg5DRAFT_5128 [Rhizobium leguminosarum bv. viciae WSM1455]|nr:hypothetical protein Rleg5DRAFT_5128 [Rhizobium leguminosarum bv. viciae WSM1455]